MAKVSDLLMGFPEGARRALIERHGVQFLDLPVHNITSDSKEVRAGSVFVAVRGGAHDGHSYIEASERAGAILVVGENASSETKPYLRVPDARKALAMLAANYYANPSREMVVIGVTGTSGKTTTTYLIESILKAAGHEVGVIGTVNFRYGSRIFPSTHTTPGSVELQRLLREMKSAGCTAIVMEVSSHALKQHRTACIAFDACVFTNLSPEHLDFHADMEDYFLAKGILFTDSLEYSLKAGKSCFPVVNLDDEYGQRLMSQLRSHPIGFSLGEVTGLKVGIDGIRGKLTQAGGITIHSSLLGRFNAYNVMAAACVGLGLKIDPEKISTGIKDLEIVPGRLEQIGKGHDVHVLVDYAHKPDALDKVLRTLGEMKGNHRVITVFGCGGDRDRKKRPVMGKTAVELSDFVWITSDNPRTENPDSIIQEILNGIPADRFSNFKVESDRKMAIHSAIRMAKKGDIVLIAGKGHEDYQIIRDPSQPGGVRKIHFDDREVAAEALDTGF